MLRKTLSIALVVALAVGASLASTSGLWIHIKVDDDGERVRINIPMSLVAELLPLVHTDELHNGRIRLGALDLDEFGDMDLRAIWEILRDAEDAEFVRVQSDDADIRVVKEGDWFLVETTEDSRADKVVNVRIPLAVVDALFSGDADELDLMAALEALGDYGQGDLVQVRDGDTTIRIWVDDRNTDE